MIERVNADSVHATLLFHYHEALRGIMHVQKPSKRTTAFSVTLKSPAGYATSPPIQGSTDSLPG